MLKELTTPKIHDVHPQMRRFKACWTPKIIASDLRLAMSRGSFQPENLIGQTLCVVHSAHKRPNTCF